MRNILLFHGDIQKYPPILTIIDVLLKNKEEVLILGYCSDKNTIKKFEERGASYLSLFSGYVGKNRGRRLLDLLMYKKNSYKYIKNNITLEKNVCFWLFNERTLWLFKDLVIRYKSIVYLFEIPNFSIPFKYKFLITQKEYFKCMSKSWKVVCCEYNRARIVESYFELNEMPYIIPNKPSVEASQIIPLSELDKSLSKLFFNKKIILYQGAFNYPERKLDELCLSIEYLPEDFNIVLMGGDSEYKKRLHKLYQSDRIHFIPFVSSPYHLSITKEAYIGFLSYGAMRGDLLNTLNTLYCAPNKVYEYSMFNKPMIASNNPALKQIFDCYHIGLIVDNYTPKEIAETIIMIDENYSDLVKNSLRFYNDTNIEGLIMSLLQ